MRSTPSIRARRCIRLATAVAMAATATSSGYAHPASAGAAPTIEIVDPMATDPLLVAGHATDGPLTRHHVVFSRAKFGTRLMEIGYNNYLAGFKVDSAYAFKNADGLCYIPSGNIEISSDGVVVKLTPHMAMWRPAGAMTEHFETLQDSVTICAVSPARDDPNKAQLGKAEVGRWTGDPALQPRVHFYANDFVIPEGAGPAFGAGPVVERRIVSLHKDGSTKLALTHLTFAAGASFGDHRKKGEQFCWLESGKMNVVSAGTTSVLNARNFLYRPEGVAIEAFHALENSALVCFSAPAGR